MIGALLGLDEFALELGRDAIVRAVKPTELAVLAEVLGGEGLVHGESLLGELGELHLLDDFPLGRMSTEEEYVTVSRLRL